MNPFTKFKQWRANRKLAAEAAQKEKEAQLKVFKNTLNAQVNDAIEKLKATGYKVIERYSTDSDEPFESAFPKPIRAGWRFLRKTEIPRKGDKFQGFDGHEHFLLEQEFKNRTHGGPERYDSAKYYSGYIRKIKR